VKKIAQVANGILGESELIGWKRYLDKLIILDNVEDANPEIPAILPANPIGFSHYWMKNKLPFFAVNRQYIGSWLPGSRSAYRVSVNSFACTKIGKISHPRWSTTGLEERPWAVKEIKNVLIAPSKKSQFVFTNQDPLDWANDIKCRLEKEGANVRIRPKVGKRKTQLFGDLPNGFRGLFGEDGDLEWADLVIGYSTATTAEAFWYGKKVISLGVCPTWVACDNSLDNWKDPTEPKNRKLWHEHISWVQFKYEDWESGAAQDMTVHYQGWPTEVPNTNNEILSD
jgi:hypothetical protein